jgi:hypothetical protein
MSSFSGIPAELSVPNGNFPYADLRGLIAFAEHAVVSKTGGATDQRLALIRLGFRTVSSYPLKRMFFETE